MIGTQLWEHALGQSLHDHIGCLYATYSGDADTCRFFEQRGFRPWFTLERLQYVGVMFPETNAAILPYEDRFFHDYLDTINLCFREMREANNIEPHIIFNEEAFADEKLRVEILARRHLIWVLADGISSDSKLIGFVELEDPAEGDGDSIDILAVRPEYQRQGLGGLLVRFGLNRLIDNGVKPAFIEVVSTNTHVRRLYESVGCEYIMSWRHSRKV